MRNKKRHRGSERGAALVIAIFSLMLISVVATSLILTSDTQTAVKTNYKSAMRAFYDAKAGLEEARGRLWTNNPNSAPVLNCVFPGGVAIGPGQACYITNPPGQNVDPRNTATSNPYADLEFQQEWGTAPPPGAQLITSTSPSPNGAIPGPLYNWVRITPRTEFSAGLDINGGTQRDPATPLFFDGAHQVLGPSTGTGQVLTITSLAVTPSGSRRMLQYSVAPATLGTAFAGFPSALTLAGNGVSFTGPSGSQPGHGGGFQINGNDSSAPTGTVSGVPAIGYTNSNDGTSVSASAVPASNYLSPAAPSVGLVTLPPAMQTPSSLNGLVNSITQTADLVLTPLPGTAVDQASLPSGMSSTNPMVVVVNGNFNLHGNGTGYGLLVVTGTLDYDPDASWNGLILVIGQGIFTSSKAGVGGINGAVLVAQTRDAAGKLLPDPNLGRASFTQTGGGSGIHYSSNWVSATEALLPYQVLSFREIQQTGP